MLYLAHFSFVEYGQNLGYGDFSFLVEAEDPDAAVEKMHDRLPLFRQESELFQGQTHVFIDDIIEVRELPEEGILAHFLRYSGEQPSLVGNPLPEQDIEGIEVWNVDRGDSENGTTGVEPFLVFD